MQAREVGLEELSRDLSSGQAAGGSGRDGKGGGEEKAGDGS